MNDGLDNPSRNRDEIERSAGIRQQSFSLRGELVSVSVLVHIVVG